VELAARQVETARANIGVLSAQLRPGFRLGYSAQQYFEGGYLSGLEAGITLPLFNGVTRRRIEAGRLGVTAAETELKARRLRYAQDLLQARSELQQAAVTADYYAEQLALVNPEIVRVSSLNYRAGEIGYLELLSALRLLGENGVEYLNAVANHNLAVARLRYLINQ
jgi:cobalt-zinc-cadmium resistance protein CzcA